MEREGLPENIPRVFSTSASETGSRTIREPSWLMAMRVPGSIPREALISAGMTNCPFVLTVVIREDMSYIVHQSKTKDGCAFCSGHLSPLQF